MKSRAASARLRSPPRAGARAPLLSAAAETRGNPTQAYKAYRAIRQRILQWHFAPDSVIQERALMDELAIGRTPIREALLRLASDRLVVFQRNQSIRIAPVHFNEVRDLYEVRLQSERLSASLCLARMTRTQSAAFEDWLADAERFVRAGDDEAVFNLDFRFHGLFYEGCGNAVLVDQHDRLAGHFYRLAYLMYYLRGEPSRASRRAFVDSHRPLVDAVLSGDGARLDEAVYEHVIASFEGIVRVINDNRMALLADLAPRGVKVPDAIAAR